MFVKVSRGQILPHLVTATMFLFLMPHHSSLISSHLSTFLCPKPQHRTYNTIESEKNLMRWHQNNIQNRIQPLEQSPEINRAATGSRNWNSLKTTISSQSPLTHSFWSFQSMTDQQHSSDSFCTSQPYFTIVSFILIILQLFLIN